MDIKDPPSHPARSCALLIFSAFLSLYLLTAQGTIQSSDGTVMYLLTKSIVERGEVSWSPEDSPYGSTTDGNRKYSKFGLGFSLITIPFYLSGKLLASAFGIPTGYATKFLVSFINPFVAAGICAVFFLMANNLFKSTPLSLFLTLCLGLSTLIWVYSKSVMSDPLNCLLIMLAAYYLFFLKGDRGLMVSGLFLGLAIITRISSGILILPFSIYVLIRECGARSIASKFRELVALGLPIFFCLCVILFYNYIRFGDPLNTGYIVSRHMTFNFFEGLWGLLFSPGRSIFIFSPVLIISIFGFWGFYKKFRAEAIFSAILTLVSIFLIACWQWWGGAEYGSRHLLYIIPFLLLPLGFLLQRKGVLFLSIIVTLAGVFIQLPGVIVHHQRYYYQMMDKYPENYTRKFLFDVNEHIVIRQWENSFLVVRNLLDKEKRGVLLDKALKGEEFRRRDMGYLLKNALSINVPNFWWVYLALYGFPVSVIVAICLALFVLSAFFFYRLFKNFATPWPSVSSGKISSEGT